MPMPKGIPKNGINKGWFVKGSKMSEETKEKIRRYAIENGVQPPIGRKQNHSQWIKDRTKVKGRHERTFHDPCYKYWRWEVYSRDGFKCRIANESCVGRIEAHHILGWKSYPELRYETNNGITLCHAHHPRKRAEEKRLVPTFKELVSVSK